jgi:hypothetical protein
MQKKLMDFRSFVYKSSMNEGILSKTKGIISSFSKKIGSWVSNFKKALSAGKIPLVPSGANKGLPMVICISAEEGNMVQQFRNYYPDKAFEGYSFNEELKALETGDPIPLEYTEEGEEPEGGYGVRNLKGAQALIKEIKMNRKKFENSVKHTPLFIFGAPGIGKTEIVIQACEEMGLDFAFIDLQFMQPTDFTGMPTSVEIKTPDIENRDYGKGVTRFDLPTLLPTEESTGGKPGILFLDEFNRAPGRTIQSLMQFIQEGRINEYYLPDNWYIVAAGNRSIEAEVTVNDAALSQRFIMMNFVPTVEDYDKFRQTSTFKFKKSRKKESEEIHGETSLSEIVPATLISFFKNYQEDSVEQSWFHRQRYGIPEKSFPSPRNWTKAFIDMYQEAKIEGLKSWEDLDKERMKEILTQYVGTQAARAWSTFLEMIVSTGIDFDRLVPEIMEGKGLEDPITGVKNPGSIQMIKNFENMSEIKLVGCISVIFDIMRGKIIDDSKLNEKISIGKSKGYPAVSFNKPNLKAIYYLFSYLGKYGNTAASKLSGITVLKKDFPILDNYEGRLPEVDQEALGKYEDSPDQEIVRKILKITEGQKIRG